MDRRRAFRESKRSPQTQGSGYSSICFLVLPLVMWCFVFLSVQEDRSLGGDAVSKTMYVDYGGNGTLYQSSLKKSTEIPLMGLWISVESWADTGPLEWKQVFAEVNVLANRLAAVVVEPEILDGMLVPCGDGSMSLSDIYNRSILTKDYPWLATCGEFQSFQNQLTAPKIFDICLANDGDVCVTRKGEWITPSYFQKKTMHTLDQALRDFQINPHSILLVRLHNVGVSALGRLTVPAIQRQEKRLGVLDHTEVQQYMSLYLHFRQSHYDLFHAQFNAASIDSYAVLHWNPNGLARGFFMDCAEKLVDAQHAMDPTDKMQFFVLTTSLSSLDPGLVASGQSKESNDKALNFLVAKGLKQFDQMLPSLETPILYTIMNMILVEQASAFSTCSDQCRKRYGVCQKCHAAGGMYGKMMMETRNKNDSQTLPCWPETSAQVPSINKLWIKH